MINYDAFALRFPEFATEDADEQTRIGTFIAMAGRNVGKTAWGDSYNDGVSYLTAHFYSLAKTTETGPTAGVGGAVSAVRAGGLGVSYAVPAAMAATPSGGDLNALSQTSYGRTFDQLRSNLGLTGLVTG